MTPDEVIAKIQDCNRAELARLSLPDGYELKTWYRYLRHLAAGKIKNPGSRQMDTLRSYFLSSEIKQRRHG